MRIASLIATLVASATLMVLGTAGTAFAGGRPTPDPPWLGPFILFVLSATGVIFAAVVVFGIVQRRDRER